MVRAPSQGPTACKVTQHRCDAGSPGTRETVPRTHPVRRIACRTALTAEPSCKDEARIGQKNGLVRQWATRGTRPRQPADQRYESAYLFGAICPARGSAPRLRCPSPTPRPCSFTSRKFPATSPRGLTPVLLLDRAGWHTTAKLDMPTTSRRSSCLPAPELNPQGKHLAVHARKTGSQTSSSTPTKTSSMSSATLGANSSPSQK